MPESDQTRDFFHRQLTGWRRDASVAGAFLTRLPFPAVEGAQAKNALALAARAFPLVGVVVGAAGAVALLASSSLGVGLLPAGILGLALMALVTGALHEDGLADMVDGFGGGASQAQKLKIMKDARLGVYGVLALVFSVGLRAGALATFATPEAAALALVAAASLSRGVLPASMHFLPAVRKTGLAHKAGRPDQESWVTALVLGGLFAFLFLGPAGGLIAIVFGIAGAALVAWLAWSQIGGLTGDVIGAEQQVSEAAILIAAAVIAS